jgi:hypothetical protein
MRKYPLREPRNNCNQGHHNEAAERHRLNRQIMLTWAITDDPFTANLSSDNEIKPINEAVMADMIPVPPKPTTWLSVIFRSHFLTAL